MNDRLTFYHPSEERLNVLTHGLGLVLSIFALGLLITYALKQGSTWHLLSFTVYGVSLVSLYAASTLYHSVQEPSLRYKLNILDHAAIYVLIAGSYTPFAVHVLAGSTGWILLGVIWTSALIGVTLKLFFTGKYGVLSTLTYVLMGWLAIFAIGPFVKVFDLSGVIWVFVGGAAYTLGAVLYGLKMIRFNHALFHVFVLVGSFCHFVSVFFYVLPHR